MLAGRPVVIVMVKTPRPGRVKTRLARDLGTVAAAGWQRRQTDRLLRRLGQDQRFDLWLSVAPDGDACRSVLWPAGLRLLRQGRGGLGDRMVRALKAAAPRPAILIGADIPAVTPAHLHRAFRALGRADLVLGPATDGGFWLIGARGRVLAGAERRLRGVRWSASTTITETMSRFQGMRIESVDLLRDVDSEADLAQAGAARAGQEQQ